MSEQRIIYPSGDGIAVLIPTGLLPVSEVARKDVPNATPYRIVDTGDIPADRGDREFWTADFSAPDGHGIGAAAWFAELDAVCAALPGEHDVADLVAIRDDTAEPGAAEALAEDLDTTVALLRHVLTLIDLEVPA
mgnify:CR=1 FL=1